MKEVAAGFSHRDFVSGFLVLGHPRTHEVQVGRLSFSLFESRGAYLFLARAAFPPLLSVLIRDRRTPPDRFEHPARTPLEKAMLLLS